jgi:hypothetical protein
MIFAEARAGLTGPAQETQHVGSEGGRAYTRTVITQARSSIVHSRRPGAPAGILTQL